MKRILDFLKSLVTEEKTTITWVKAKKPWKEGRQYTLKDGTVLEGKEVNQHHFSLRKLTIIATTLMGIGFGIFFIEEADQKIVYGMFSVLDVGNYERAQKSLDTMKTVQKWGLGLNNAIGWVNPVCYIGYRMYFRQATDTYIKNIETVIAYHKDNTATLPAVAPSPPSTAQGASPTTKVSMFLQPPTVEGAIGVEDAYKWVGWEKTVIVPVSAIDVREKVSIMKTPTPFSVVTFPSTGIDIHPFYNKWVVIRGEIKDYKGAPEMILTSLSQIKQTAPLTKDGG